MQGPTALAVGAGGGCVDIFTLIYPFSSLSPSLWETIRYRLKYCLKGSLSPKTTNQPMIFQKSDLDVAMVQVSIEHCKSSLEKLGVGWLVVLGLTAL